MAYIDEFKKIVSEMKRLMDDEYDPEQVSAHVFIDGDGDVCMVVHNDELGQRVTAYFDPKTGTFKHGLSSDFNWER